MNIALIFAGGVGKRMGTKDIPKQFLVVHGKPVIVHTIQKFQSHPLIDAIVIVCVADWIDYCRGLIDKFRLTKVSSIVPGGTTGQKSIFNGLIAVKDIYKDPDTIVLIHDGVRPLITKEVISKNIEAVLNNGSAVTCSSSKETVLILSNGREVSSIPVRDNVKIAKAPQSFYLKDIYEAHLKAINDQRNDFIDSASLISHYGYKLFTIDGPYENIKITTQDDYYAFQAYLNSLENNQLLS